MMPQNRYLDCVGRVMGKIEQLAKAGENMLVLTDGPDDFGIIDRGNHSSPGTTQIGLVVKELKRLGFHVAHGNPTGTSLVVIW